jgi:uncharacterized NAD(P)/FAD-binding protein YdhS
MVAVNLARRSLEPLRIALIDRAGAFACGAAYSTNCGEHVLNVPAGAMGAFPDAPGDFVRWLREANALAGAPVDDGAFLSRGLYGRYVHSLLEGAERLRHHIARIELDIVDLIDDGDAVALIARDGSTACVARAAVLALGALAPKQPAGLRAHPRYVADPCAFLRAPAFDRSGGDTLVIGTGLTALDVLLSFQHEAPPGRVFALSRRGRFPLPHAAAGPPRDPFAGEEALPATAHGAVRHVRAAARAEREAGRDWRAVVDGVRPRVADLWHGWSPRERRRFLRHARSAWESHRHRAPRESLAAKDDLIARGKLVVLAGRLAAVDTRPGAAADDALEIRYVERGSGQTHTLRVATVINCAGPSTDYANAESLVANLSARGGLVCDGLGMGLQARRDGRLVDASGNVHERLRAIGWPLRGALYETTAVRELREQAQAVAGDLIAMLTEA